MYTRRDQRLAENESAMFAVATQLQEHKNKAESKGLQRKMDEQYLRPVA